MSDHIPDTGKMVPDAWMEAADRVLVPGKPMTTSDLRKALAAVAPLIAAAERERVAALVEALEWFIDNDDTNEGDHPLAEHGGRTWNEINAYWLDGLNRARAALALYRGEAGR